MIVNLLDTDYCTAVENYIADIEDNYKYLDSYRMSFESSILLKESFEMEELNEAVGEYWDKFKAKIKAFINAIKELWTKFWSKIENKVMSDVEWLKTYKSALLKAKIPDADYDMYGYFETGAVNFRNKLLGDNLIPSYNPNDTKLFDALESSEKFRAEYLKDFAVKDKNLNEGIKFKCRGSMDDPKTYGKAEITTQFSKMIEYCLNYPTLARTLQKEKDNLERDLNRISRDIDKIKVNQKEEKQESTQYFINMAKAELLVEGCLFSQLPLMERVELFNEEVKIEEKTDTTKKGAVTRDDDGKIGKVDSEVKDNDTKENITKRFSVYMTEVYNIIGIRMTVCEEIYTTYMQILRYIGKDFTKKDKSTTSKDGTKVNISGNSGKKNITANTPHTAQGPKKGLISAFKDLFK